MRRAILFFITGFLTTAAWLYALRPEEATAAPTGDALSAVIAAREGELFAVYFQGCDPKRLAGMVTDDLEFYHDKTGAQFGAKPFLDDYTRKCAERSAADAWRVRRALVPASLHVDVVPGYGAIEDGEHLFYERQGDGPERLAGRARFTMLWKQDGETWKLARVMSFAHAPAG